MYTHSMTPPSFMSFRSVRPFRPSCRSVFFSARRSSLFVPFRNLRRREERSRRRRWPSGSVESGDRVRTNRRAGCDPSAASSASLVYSRQRLRWKPPLRRAPPPYRGDHRWVWVYCPQIMMGWFPLLVEASILVERCKGVVQNHFGQLRQHMQGPASGARTRGSSGGIH